MSSASYVNYFGPVRPDNWLISPTVPGGGSVSFKIIGQDPEYPAEPMDVYAKEVGTTDWGSSLGHFVATAEAAQHTVDLSQFEGKQIQIAFRHHGVTDMFYLNLDAVEVTPGEWYVPEYKIEVENGTAKTEAGLAVTEAEEGAVIAVTAAAAPDGMEFDKWEVVSGGVGLEDESSAATTFAMPGEDARLRAVYRPLPAAPGAATVAEEPGGGAAPLPRARDFGGEWEPDGAGPAAPKVGDGSRAALWASLGAASLCAAAALLLLSRRGRHAGRGRRRGRLG